VLSGAQRVALIASAPAASFLFEFEDGVADGDESGQSSFSARPNAMHISQTEIQSRSTAAGDNDRIGVLVIQYIRNPMSRLFHKAVVPQPEHPSLAGIYRELWASPAPYSSALISSLQQAQLSIPFG
jgi:hypothetical protein